MYKCRDCGMIFSKPKVMVESHGEELAHCPECMGIALDDVDDLRCSACGDGVVDHRGDNWCHDCRLSTKRIMHDCIIKAVNHTGAKMAEVVNTFEDTMRGKKIETFKESQIVRWLMIGVMMVAFETGADIHEAFEMVEAWAIGTME